MQIRRPNNYDINVSLMLGPTEPDPTMDVSSLDIVKTVVQDSPHKLFIGGLPCDWSEDQVNAPTGIVFGSIQEAACSGTASRIQELPLSWVYEGGYLSK